MKEGLENFNKPKRKLEPVPESDIGYGPTLRVEGYDYDNKRTGEIVDPIDEYGPKTQPEIDALREVLDQVVGEEVKKKLKN